MNELRKRIAVLLVVALLLSLSACREDPGVGDPPIAVYQACGRGRSH